ncbi:MAG: hypothetical protein AAB884_02335 [Patescibacteria group bacterium]
MLLGHQEKLKSFENLVRDNTLGHAYLFYGDAQIGKFLFARSLANYLEVGKFEASQGILIDANVFSPNEKGIIGIDLALDVRRFLWRTPIKSKKRLAIIDSAESLTSEAQSALLKIVEEPSERAVIIFIVHDSTALFPPLLSRLTKVYFNRFSATELKNILVKHYKISEKNAEDLAHISFGRLGRALGLMKDQGGRDESFEAKLEEKIVKLRNKDIVKNASILSWLIRRLESLRRYNLNTRLQEASINYKIQL